MIHVTVQIVSVRAPLIQIIFGPAVTSVPERGPEYEIVFCPAHFHVFLLHKKVTDDEGVPSLVSNLSVQVFYHMKKLLMTGKSSVFYHREKGRVRVTDDQGWSVEVKSPSRNRSG